MEISKFSEDLFGKYLDNIEPPFSDFIDKAEKKIDEASSEAQDFNKEYDSPQAKVSQILKNKHKHPASLNYALRLQFGKSWINWEPETIEQTINKILSIKIDKFDKNMIGSLKSLFNSSKFFQDYRVFGWSVYALNQKVPRMNVIPRPQPGMLLDTYASTPKIRSGIYKDEVKRYVNEELKEYGVKPIPGLIIGDNETDEANSNIKSYLNTKNKDKIEKLLSYLQEENKQHILKTIGMIDYYMARLNLAMDQLNSLQE